MKGAVGRCIAPSLCSPLLGPLWLASCSLSPTETAGKFNLFSCPQFPQQQGIISLMASHIFLYVPNSRFQPEHTSQDQRAPWTLSKPPPLSLPFPSPGGGGWTGDIPEIHPSLSTLISRDPGILWGSVTTESQLLFWGSTGPRPERDVRGEGQGCRVKRPSVLCSDRGPPPVSLFALATGPDVAGLALSRPWKNWLSLQLDWASLDGVSILLPGTPLPQPHTGHDSTAQVRNRVWPRQGSHSQSLCSRP